MAARPPTFTPSRAPHPSRAARHAPPPERSRLKRVLRWALWLIVPMLAVIAGSLVGLVYAFARVRVLDQVPAAQTTVFLDRKGAEIGTLSPSENRRIVPLSDIPRVMQRAVLAAEDRDFYGHGAVSYRGMLRATLADVRRAGVSQGGSTITQQYVKNAYPNVGRRRNLFRKLKETVIAVKLEKRYSKEQILGFYLNTVYFGKGAYGVDAASRVFFGHPARKLTTTESALLAATIRAPEFYSKKQNAISAKARRNYVLQIMRDRGWITPKQAAAATRAPVRERWTVKPTGIPHSKAPYFLEKVRQYLLDKYGPGRLAQDGFRVRTTIDMGMQRQAGRPQGLPGGARPQDRRGAGHVRRPQLREGALQLRHRRDAAGRLHHEAVRAPGGAERRVFGELGLPRAEQARDPGPRVLELRHRELRRHHPDGRDQALGQHRLRPAHRQARPAARRRPVPPYGTRRRDRGRPLLPRAQAPAHPGRPARARRQRRLHPPARLRLRDLGRPGRPPPDLPGRAGHRLQREGARAAPGRGQAGHRPQHRQHRHAGAARRGRGRHRHQGPPARPHGGRQDRHHQRLGRRPLRGLRLEPGHLGVDGIREQAEATSAQGRPRLQRGLGRHAAGHDLAALHDRGDQGPAAAALPRAAARRHRAELDHDHVGPAPHDRPGATSGTSPFPTTTLAPGPGGTTQTSQNQGQALSASPTEPIDSG